MRQGNNGILLKINPSLSKKRIIQAKNINFISDYQKTGKFKSLSPSGP